MIDWSAERNLILSGACDFSLPDDIKLPMMPTVVTEFIQKANDDRYPAKKLGALIETDTGLTCDLLRHINSAAFGVRKQISTPSQAMMLIGIKKTKMLLLTSAVKRSMNIRESKWINIKHFWVSNLERALFAKEIAKQLGADQDTSFAAALLQDFLLPILTNQLIHQYIDFSENDNESLQTLADYEMQKFGWNHATAGAHVLHHWGFPDELVCCLYHHHQGSAILSDAKLGKTSVAAVALAALIPDAIRQTPHGLSELLQLDQQWNAFNLEAISEIVEAQFLEMSSNANSHISLKNRVQKALLQSA